jgi:hypothetical protein
VDVRLSAEQVALRDSVASAVAKLGPRSVADLDDVRRSARLDAVVEAAGWREIRMADDDGSPLASGVEVAIVAEELGAGAADVPYLGPILAAELRRLAGLPVATVRETVALTADMESLASPRGHGWGGALCPDAAGAATSLARSDGGGAIVSVELSVEGDHMDLTRPIARVRSDCTHEDLGGVLHADAATRWEALALALTAADLVGAMRGAVAIGRTYAADRHQYGTPIGSFQAVQHMLADAYVMMEGSHSAALQAAWAVDALDPAEALATAAGAKAYCSRAARSVCETVIQVHGGIGNTWECMAHVFLRRTLGSIDILGGEGTNLERVLAHRGVPGLATKTGTGS